VRDSHASRSMAPTLLRWKYDGGQDGSAEAARRGEQRAYADDVVVDDAFGRGKLKGMGGSDLQIIFDGDEDVGERVRLVSSNQSRGGLRCVNSWCFWC
jgi:hypothetical protein